MVPIVLAPSVVKHALGGTYVVSTAAGGYEVGQTIGLAVTTLVAIASLSFAIWQSNRKTRRELAEDRRSYGQDEYERGKAELQPWLDYWKERATGRVQGPPPPAHRRDDDSDS